MNIPGFNKICFIFQDLLEILNMVGGVVCGIVRAVNSVLVALDIDALDGIVDEICGLFRDTNICDASSANSNLYVFEPTACVNDGDCLNGGTTWCWVDGADTTCRCGEPTACAHAFECGAPHAECASPWGTAIPCAACPDAPYHGCGPDARCRCAVPASSPPRALDPELLRPERWPGDSHCARLVRMLNASATRGAVDQLALESCYDARRVAAALAERVDVPGLPLDMFYSWQRPLVTVLGPALRSSASRPRIPRLDDDRDELCGLRPPQRTPASRRAPALCSRGTRPLSGCGGEGRSARAVPRRGISIFVRGVVVR